MEGGLLSSQDLAPLYDRAAWMYLFQDFSGSEADRRAERVSIRFGITAWPQHFLIDPTDLRVLDSTGRELASFQAAFDAAPTIGGTASPTAEELAACDSLADRIQTASSAELAKRSLDHEDIVVRFCAARSLAEHEPKTLAAASAELLQVEHDQLRFLVCGVLMKEPNVAVAGSLERLLRTPSGSKNPNRLRCEVARALGQCGGPSSFAVLSDFGVGGAPNNTLTRCCLESVAAIARRDDSSEREATRSRARDILVRSFPVPLAPASETEAADKVAARRAALVTSLAESIHELLTELTGTSFDFPGEYDQAAREDLMRRWAE